MDSTAASIERLRSAAEKRSSKRDVIVNVFLRQEGHLSADDLAGLIRRADQTISRATVYRTLQWMVEAGIARKVDLGGGRFRFEHSYRHPRHFHLICKACDTSVEFLSSDIEGLLDEVAAAHSFAARQSVLQIYGTCEACQTGRRPVGAPVATDVVFARDALRIAIATERSGREFYARAARGTRDTRWRSMFERLAAEERGHQVKLEERYRHLLTQDRELESRPTFLFFKGAANGLFAAGAEQLRRGATVREALLVAIKCERSSHRFFKRYGERFEDPERKQAFLELADEEREHLELLIREYRALGARTRKRRGARRKAASARSARHR